MAETVDGIRFLVGAAILAYATVSDLRVRRVPNPTWLVGGGIGAVLLAIEYFGTDRVNVLHLVLIPVIMIVAYLLWYVHLIAGGADSKAIMMLAVLVPVPINWKLAGRQFPVWDSVLPPAFVIFANSLLVFVLFPVGLFAYNLVKNDVRLPSMFLGYRMDLEAAARSFVWVAETPDGKGGTKQLLWSSRLDREQQAENVQRLRDAGVRRVWVTPKFPFMVPLLGGFVTAFFAGDVFSQFLVKPFLPGP